MIGVRRPGPALDLIAAAAVVLVALATGPVDAYPWWTTAMFAAALFVGTAHTLFMMRVHGPEMWRRWRSNACLDCGHTYPATEFPGAEPRPACECCQERH